MSIRTQLSLATKSVKESKGYTYKDLKEGTGCSISSIRYALNGGDNVGIEVFQKLLDFMEEDIQISVYKRSDFEE